MENPMIVILFSILHVKLFYNLILFYVISAIICIEKNAQHDYGEKLNVS